MVGAGGVGLAGALRLVFQTQPRSGGVVAGWRGGAETVGLAALLRPGRARSGGWGGRLAV